MNLKLLFGFSLLLSIITRSVNAQYLKDINGRPIATMYNSDIEGTPYLNDTWGKGVVKFNNGATYKDISLKYDIAAELLYFQDNTGQTLSFADPIQSFKISYIDQNKPQEKYFKSGYKNIPNTSANTLFEVLSDGTVQLVKFTKKKVTESKEYNAASVSRRFEDVSKYYLIIGDNAIPFKKDKKFILTNLPSKQTEVEAYIKANSINVKEDADLIKLFTYYNSI